MEDNPIDNQKLWSTVFKLYDRDNSGFADQGDTIAAMVTMGHAPEVARQMLTRRCDDGLPNLELFQLLLEECVSLNAGVDIGASGWQKELVKHLLGVLKEFEKRALARGEFMIAAESRHRVKQLKETEELRQKDEMVVRQGTEKSGVAEAHVREAVEFNKAWTTNMSEFELRATQIVQELRRPLPYPYPYPHPTPTPTPTPLLTSCRSCATNRRPPLWPSLRPPVWRRRRASSHPRSAPPPHRLCTASARPLCYVHARRCFPITYGCSRYHIWLQPPSHMVAGGARPDQDAGAVGALGQLSRGAEDREEGAREPAQGRLVDAGDTTHTHATHTHTHTQTSRTRHAHATHTTRARHARRPRTRHAWGTRGHARARIGHAHAHATTHTHTAHGTRTRARTHAHAHTVGAGDGRRGRRQEGGRL